MQSGFFWLKTPQTKPFQPALLTSPGILNVSISFCGSVALLKTLQG